MKNKKQVFRSRKLEIKNPSKRTMEQKGFDDMVAIALGDESKVCIPQENVDSLADKNNFGSFYELTQKEDKDRKKAILILGIVAILCITLIIITVILVEHHREQIDGKIRVNYSSRDLKGDDYKKVIKKLKKQGFTNIVTEPIDDLITGWITKDGEVEEVIIEGDSTFSTRSRYSPDVEIVVRYHTFP